MLKNPNFRGSAPDPASAGACSAPREPLADGEVFTAHLPSTPPPQSALRASFLRVSGSNPLQNDLQIYIYTVVKLLKSRWRNATFPLLPFP